MFTFKQYLIEKKMSAAVYSQVFKRLEDSAKIGFEIEVFIPEGSYLHKSQDVISSKVVKLDDISTWSEFQMYFSVSNQQEGSITGDFEKWRVEKEDDWVDEHWEDFVTGEESRTIEKGARRAALKHATTLFTWDQWLATFESKQDFVGQYELEPTYGWGNGLDVHTQAPEQAGYHNGFRNSAEELAGKLTTVLKQPVKVNGVGYAYWNITHDTSIKDSDGKSDEEDQAGYGAEIISPPLSPSKALDQLEKVFTCLKQYDIETNESTGIHVNISLDNMKNFDPLKLVLFMGDEYILRKFDRTANTYTLSQLQQVISSIHQTGTIPKSNKEIIALAQQGLEETGKYYSVNLLHLPKYLEFRAAGGKDYHRRLNDIREVTGRWLTAVELAANPNMQRAEYMKKVHKLLDKGSDSAGISALSFEQLILKCDGKYVLDNWNENKTGTKFERTMAAFAVFMNFGSHIKSLSTPTFAQMKEAREFLKETGVSAHEILAAAQRKDAAEMVLLGLQHFKLLGK